LILIVTNEQDLTSDYVVLELRKRGRSYVRLNTETIPNARVSLGFADTDDWSIAFADRVVRGADVQAAYFRRPGSPTIDAGVENSGERAYCESEWGALLKSLYGRIGDRWLNSPQNIMLAEDKPGQLLQAQMLGFKVPQAIVTNDMGSADEFLSGPPCIAKPLREALLEGDAERVIFTNRVERAGLRDPRAFGAAPMILQHEIAKRVDVRVTVVGAQVFAATIASRGEAAEQVDWRRGQGGDLSYEAITLPEALADRCVRLVASLGLRFGAIDLVWDRDDEFWFLEINPNGQWAWIETRTGHPIAAAIAEMLDQISAR